MTLELSEFMTPSYIVLECG